MMDASAMRCSLGNLLKSGKLTPAAGLSEDALRRIENLTLDAKDVARLFEFSNALNVTSEFQKVIDTFQVEAATIPAGFRPEFVFCGDGSVKVDLRRDISYDANGEKRPTNVLFSANTANPNDVRAMSGLIAKITTNPQLIYEHFLNNPKANVNGQYKDRYEVLAELCRILGPGADISVEVDNPFADESALLEEIAHCEEILTPYRLVVKVPHSGPLNKQNVPDFLAGKLQKGYFEPDVQDAFYGHNFALKLSRMGYRVNFTLMFDPHQTALALQTRPAFINAFVEMRHANTLAMSDLLNKLDSSGNVSYAEKLKELMMSIYEWPLGKKDAPVSDVVERARQLVDYRELDTPMGFDGLDSVRYSLRWLRNSNLPDTRLIICNTKTPQTYWNIDKMLTEPEFADMVGRVVLSCDTPYFAQFTGAAGIYHYQKSFLSNSPSK